MSISDPFAAAIADAEAAELEATRLREEQELLRAAAQAEAAAALALAQAEEAEQRHLQDLVDFGRRFLEVVVQKVVLKGWKADYIRLIQTYAQALLSPLDKQLPRINDRHAARILDIFGYGLKLAAQNGVEIDEGFFYGQRVLTERKAAAEAAKSEPRVVIKPGDRPRGQRPDTTTSTATNLPAATTQKVKKDRRPATVRT